jgi:DNA helicase-2/ATP-dependent DNA helicase PcrA
MLDDLNAKQREAVMNTEGPVLVIAGAGAGKTKTLTHRIVYLIREKGVRPENILAVTFTNKAASEMRSRVLSLLAGKRDARSAGTDEPFSRYFYDPAVPLIGTFHSLCVRILREDAHHLGLKRDFVIYDSDDQLSLVKKIMKELNLSTEQLNPRAVHAAISDAKNSLKTASELANMADGVFAENAAKVYALYQKRLMANGALDFDDLIMYVTVLFAEKREVLEKYQDRFRFVMVDEYQDTNHAQYTLLYLLSKKHRNLCVVGDDWQSIYKWRGADIRNILDFEKNYPEAKTVLLEQNYRSTQNILDASYGVISRNVNRKDKRLWTEKKGGELIKVYEAANEKGEAEFIIGELAKLSRGLGGKEKTKLGDIAILYRTNAQSRAIEEAFLEYQVPYKIVGGTRFYDRREVKDVLAYLRFVQNPSDEASLERIINIPARKIGPATLKKAIALLREENKDFTEAFIDYQGKDFKGKIAALAGFAKMIRDMREKRAELATEEFLEYVLEKTDYENYIKDGTPEGDERWENVCELKSALEKYKELPAEEGMPAFLEDVALISDVDGWEEGAEAVTLMTLHAAKGLEFAAVFIVGMEEGLLPHGRAFADDSEMEEERRLCYVGMTRAKKYLYLTSARMRRIFGATQCNTESRFIGEVPAHLVERDSRGYSYLDDFYEEKYIRY